MKKGKPEKRAMNEDKEPKSAAGTPLLDALPLNAGVRVLAADPRGIFALEKPAGTMTHPNAPGVAAAKRAMLVADYSLKQECYCVRDAAGAARKIFVLNRLDSPTSGVVLCAWDEAVARLARAAFAGTGVRKTYFALVRGNAPAAARWENFLLRESRGGELRVRVAPHGKIRGSQFAATAVEKIRGNAAFALVKLSPETGRTHQLRVQCAARGMPIVGDRAYGDAAADKRDADRLADARGRLFLHAAETEIALPLRGGTLRFRASSPLPPLFDDTLARLLRGA